MKAAVLHTLGKSPRFENFPGPQAGENEVIVQVKAASLKNIDKAMASGSHYDSHRELPVICGVDGVAVLDDGTRVFWRRVSAALWHDGRASCRLAGLVFARAGWSR